MYAYCSNNPIMFVDPTGEAILTALIVGAIVGAVIGGAIGGTVAYNSAKSSGLEGTDLLLATAGGVAKGAVIGGIAGGLIGASGGVIGGTIAGTTAYGLTTWAGSAIVSTTINVTARMIEVGALQYKKSVNDGVGAWQVANNCLDAIFSNGVKIVSPSLTKAGTLSAEYVKTDFLKYKVVPLSVNDFLSSKGGRTSYLLALGACLSTLNSICCNDPVARAAQRGYTLK